MPEGHAIARIDGSHGIIAPATPGVGLVACAILHYSFPLSEITWRVTGKTSGVTNSREYAGTGHRITDSSVAVVIHGDAGHPPP
jgi:hypothetical protein